MESSEKMEKLAKDKIKEIPSLLTNLMDIANVKYDKNEAPTLQACAIAATIKNLQQNKAPESLDEVKVTQESRSYPSYNIL